MSCESTTCCSSIVRDDVELPTAVQCRLLVPRTVRDIVSYNATERGTRAAAHALFSPASCPTSACCSATAPRTARMLPRPLPRRPTCIQPRPCGRMQRRQQASGTTHVAAGMGCATTWGIPGSAEPVRLATATAAGAADGAGAAAASSPPRLRRLKRPRDDDSVGEPVGCAAPDISAFFMLSGTVEP